MFGWILVFLFIPNAAIFAFFEAFLLTLITQVECVMVEPWWRMCEHLNHIGHLLFKSIMVPYTDRRETPRCWEAVATNMMERSCELQSEESCLFLVNFDPVLYLRKQIPYIQGFQVMMSLYLLWSVWGRIPRQNIFQINAAHLMGTRSKKTQKKKRALREVKEVEGEGKAER